MNASSRQDAAAVARNLGDQWLTGDDPYESSPLAPLKALPSRTKGARMEAIVEAFLTSQGYAVTRATSSDHDRRVDDFSVEIKGSFLWAGGEPGFRWQQIRVDQDYDYLVCAAFYPDRIEYYACTHAQAKAELTRRAADGTWLHNQHGGKGVDSGTYFIQGLPEDFPWLKPLMAVLPKPSARRKSS